MQTSRGSSNDNEGSEEKDEEIVVKDVSKDAESAVGLGSD
jgi:hypothetical protein